MLNLPTPAGRALLTSKFSPRSIPGLQLWLLADGAIYQDTGFATPAVANNDPVGGWIDQSTSALNVTESTNKPTFKTNVLNGKPVIEFDGTNDKLTNVTGLAQGDFTVFIVARIPSVAADKACFFWGKRASAESRQFHHSGTADSRQFIGYVADRASTSAWGNNTWSAWSVTGSGVPTSGTATATITHRVNGAAAGSGVTGSALKAFTTNALYVGADPDGEYWSGQIAEIVAYNSVLNASQIAAVESYLNSKWAVY